MPKKKMTRIKLSKSGEFYAYKGGQYVRQELNNDRGCVDYRIKEVKPKTKILICITNKKGKRGGSTKAVSLLRRVDRDLRTISDKKVKNAIKKFRKMKDKKIKKVR